MKAINKILPAGLVVMSLAACNDLDTEMYGAYATGEQKKELVDQYPEKLVAAVSGISASATQYASIWPEEENVQNDYGMPSLMLALDNRGMDMFSVNSGYNWYMQQNSMSDAVTTSDLSLMAWTYPYQIINASNTLMATTGEENDDPEMKFFIAQARGERAAAYMTLAQIFQFTYLGHESSPCVPIVTSLNMEQIALDGGNPRASVADVYALIMEDLDVTINYLTTCELPSSIGSSKIKRYISVATAYGLRARANLLMGKWAEAAQDAQSAISNFDGAPASIQEVSAPSFWSIEQNCWMWGFAVNETDRPVTTGICNWPSYMGSFSYGYASLTPAKRFVSKTLFDQIPDTDVRKGWFLDGTGSSSTLTGDWAAYANAMLEPYTQVKFAPYQNEIGTSVNANDIVRMRIEEMYLIKAEAQAMAGSPTTGAQTLTDFVQTYRDPSYVCTATTIEDVRDAVWFQRRVELWGEGLSYFDIMRLKKGIDRRGGGWPESWVYNVPAESSVMLLPIPNDEIQANKYISESDNNPNSPHPPVVSE